jgi:hypothetical protein
MDFLTIETPFSCLHLKKPFLIICVFIFIERLIWVIVEFFFSLIAYPFLVPSLFVFFFERNKLKSFKSLGDHLYIKYWHSKNLKKKK